MAPDEILNEIRNRSRSVFPAAKAVLLFGSRARGDARRDSDYDLLVVADVPPETVGRGVPLRLALRGLGASFDIAVLTPSEFEQFKADGGWYPQQLLREAVVLHGAQ